MANLIIKKYIFSLLFCLCLLAQADAAQHNKHNSKTAVSSDSCSDPQQPANLRCAPAPSTQFDAQGRLWIVWSSGGHIYVTSSDDQGRTLKQSVVVNRIPEKISARGENRPKIVIDNKGKIYISWTTPLKKPYTGNVRFSYSDDGALNFSQPVTVNDNLDITGHRFESMAVNDQGTLFMVWLDKRDRYKARQQGKKYHGAAVYYSYSTDGGKTFSRNKNIMSHSCECCRTAIDIDTDQYPVAIWRNIYGDNIRDHSLVKFTDYDTPGKVIRMSHDYWHVEGCPHHGPALSIAKTASHTLSDYHLVWFNNAPDRHGLFYSKMTDPNKSGQTKAHTPIQIGDYTKGASHPDILSLGSKVWIVWKEFDGDQESVKLQKSHDSGDNWEQPTIVSQTKNGSDYPFLINDNNTVYLQWKTKDDGFKLLLLD